MSGKATLVSSFSLEGTKQGVITVSHLEQPYGANSEAVVSIGVSLDGDESSPDWKVHIPYAQLDDLIAALQKVKATHA